MPASLPPSSESRSLNNPNKVLRMIVSARRPAPALAYRYDAAHEAARARERNLCSRHTKLRDRRCGRDPRLFRLNTGSLDDCAPALCLGFEEIAHLRDSAAAGRQAELLIAV